MFVHLLFSKVLMMEYKHNFNDLFCYLTELKRQEFNFLTQETEIMVQDREHKSRKTLNDNR